MTRLLRYAATRGTVIQEGQRGYCAPAQRTRLRCVDAHIARPKCVSSKKNLHATTSGLTRTPCAEINAGIRCGAGCRNRTPRHHHKSKGRTFCGNACCCTQVVFGRVAEQITAALDTHASFAPRRIFKWRSDLRDAAVFPFTDSDRPLEFVNPPRASIDNPQHVISLPCCARCCDDIASAVAFEPLLQLGRWLPTSCGRRRRATGLRGSLVAQVLHTRSQQRQGLASRRSRPAVRRSSS